jgi:archaellum biogenesis ATPase FlaH
MQVQAIADRLAGILVNERLVRKAKHFAEPWKTIWEAMEKADHDFIPIMGDEPDPKHDAMLKALENVPDREKVLAEIMFATPGGKVGGKYQSLADLSGELLPIEWLWPGWIPLGMITLLGAAPGVGKSNLCLELARRVIHGEKFPDGKACSKPRSNVLYVDAENVPQIINQRAVSWDMDRTRLYLMHPDLDEILDFSQPKYRDRLTEMIAQLEPGLVIVDSLGSISSKGENSVEDVRALMSFLNMLAREYECGMVIIHHLRKHSSMQLQLFDISLDDFRGSSHIVAMARSVIGVSIVQTNSQADRNGPRRVEIVKTNLGPYPEALGFVLKDGVGGGVVLCWDAKAPETYKEPTQRDECKEWLEDFLKEMMEGKPVKPKEVIKAAVDEGFSRALVFQAKKELQAHIKNTEGRKKTGNCWQWSDQPVDSSENDDDESAESTES